MKTVWDIEIKMMVPFDVMSLFPDDDIDEYIVNPEFQELLDLMNINFNPMRLLDSLYNQDHSDTAIEVHYSTKTYDEYIVLDTYIVSTDQLDFIYIMFRGTTDLSAVLRKKAHEFYINNCPYNVVYAEGNFCINNHFKINLSDFGDFNEIILGESIKGKRIRFYRNDKVLTEYNFEGRNKEFRNPNYR